MKIDFTGSHRMRRMIYHMKDVCWHASQSDLCKYIHFGNNGILNVFI